MHIANLCHVPNQTGNGFDCRIFALANHIRHFLLCQSKADLYADFGTFTNHRPFVDRLINDTACVIEAAVVLPLLHKGNPHFFRFLYCFIVIHP